jgi:hypothetical protein
VLEHVFDSRCVDEEAAPAEEFEWGYRGNTGRVTVARDEFWARREAALIHGEVMRRRINAEDWQVVST